MAAGAGEGGRGGRREQATRASEEEGGGVGGAGDLGAGPSARREGCRLGGRTRLVGRRRRPGPNPDASAAAGGGGRADRGLPQADADSAAAGAHRRHRACSREPRRAGVAATPGFAGGAREGSRRRWGRGAGAGDRSLESERVRKNKVAGWDSIPGRRGRCAVWGAAGARLQTRAEASTR